MLDYCQPERQHDAREHAALTAFRAKLRGLCEVRARLLILAKPANCGRIVRNAVADVLFAAFGAPVYTVPTERVRRLLSSEHLSVDGTLMCQQERGADALGLIFVVKYGKEDAIHQRSVGEDAHWTGAASDFAKASLDGVGSAHGLATANILDSESKISLLSSPLGTSPDS